MEIKNDMLQAAKNGNLNAFELIVKTYERLVYSIAYKMFSNADDAKDIAQEVFIKVYRNIEKCTDAKALKGWVCTIASNTCIDEIRKRKRKEAVSLDAVIETGEGEINLNLPDNKRTPEESVLRMEKFDELKRALDKLPEGYRILVILRDIEGLSYTELAEATCTNLGTVKSRLSRARAMLKDLYHLEQTGKSSV